MSEWEEGGDEGGGLFVFLYPCLFVACAFFNIGLSGCVRIGGC